MEAAGGAILLLATAIALILANSPWSAAFASIWKTEVGFTLGSFSMMHSLKHWINDGLPARLSLSWTMITGGGFLAGIGFTMALFIAGLALKGPLLESARVGILTGSAVAAILGVGILLFALPKKTRAAS